METNQNPEVVNPVVVIGTIAFNVPNQSPIEIPIVRLPSKRAVKVKYQSVDPVTGEKKITEVETRPETAQIDTNGWKLNNFLQILGEDGVLEVLTTYIRNEGNAATRAATDQADGKDVINWNTAATNLNARLTEAVGGVSLKDLNAERDALQAKLLPYGERLNKLFTMQGTFDSLFSAAEQREVCEINTAIAELTAQINARKRK